MKEDLLGYRLLPTSNSCANVNLANHKVSFVFLVLLSHLLRVHYSSLKYKLCQIKVGGESTIFEFQGNKLLEGATNLDARYSNFNYVTGDQTIIDRRVYANTVVVIEKVVVVEKVVEKVVIVEKVVGVEKSRSVCETIGYCAVVICFTVVVGCIVLGCALVFR